MQQLYVKFDDVEQVKAFVNEINKVEANFEMGSGRRIVDAKSIIGVLSLDLTQPQELRCDSDDKGMINRIEPFLYRRKPQCVGA